MRLETYRTLVFDCDGVVLDSNRIKTEAFRSAALPYGAAAADALVAHHVANGGVSRYRKFEYFLASIVPGQEGPGLEALLAAYAAAVRAGLMACTVAPGLHPLREARLQARWLVVSGGDQAELREIFASRGLEQCFDGGIFGSPDTKDTILAREKAAGNIRLPALFIGDSRYDHEAAAAAGLDFVFLSRWSEFAGWRAYARQHGIVVREDLAALGAEVRGPAGDITRRP